MTNYLLDSSAVLALLLQESGSEYVEARLDSAFISAINSCEVLTKLIQRGISFNDAKQQLALIVQGIIPFDESIAEIAAKLTTHTKTIGLSLGDRACLATGQALNYEIITADKVWKELKLPIKIKLIR